MRVSERRKVHFGNNQKRITIHKRKIKKDRTRRCVHKNNLSYSKRIGEYREFLWKQANQTSIHGFNFIFKVTNHWLERFFWLISFTMATVNIIYLSTPLFARYETSPAVMSVEMDYFNWNTSFPAITLCPHTKVDQQRLNELVLNYDPSERENLSNFITTIASVNLYTIGAYELQDHSLVPPKEYAKIAALVYHDVEKVQLTANTNEFVKKDSVMTEMGMCDVVNSNIGQFDKPLNWDKAVPPAYEKSSIELNVHDGMFFIQTFNFSTSYNIYIHSPDDVFETTSLSYSHKSYTFISINFFIKSTKSPNKLRELSVKQRNCRYLNEPAFPRDSIYSYNRCIKECRVTMIKAMCGCIPHFYKPIGEERVCTLSELTCLVKFKKELQHFSVPMEMKKDYPGLTGLPDSVRNCGCVQNCEEYVYIEDTVDINSGRLTMMRVGVEVYPRVRYTREIIFGFYDVLVRVGGVINLCLGMSVISVAELVVFFLVKPFIYILCRILGNNKRTV